jgi:hypothetical protein
MLLHQEVDPEDNCPAIALERATMAGRSGVADGAFTPKEEASFARWSTSADRRRALWEYTPS